MSIFFAMPFSTLGYEQIVTKRRDIHRLAAKYNLNVREQFLGLEEKEQFETHSYSPLFIASKDCSRIAQSDIVIADYSSHSLGRDCEIAMAKQDFDRRVIAIVPDRKMRDHPWLRLFSDYIVENMEGAFGLASKLLSFPISQQISQLTRIQKDQIDAEVKEILKQEGNQAIFELVPTELKRRWKNLFPRSYETLVDYSFKPLPRVIRVNTLRNNVSDFVEIASSYSLELEPLGITPIAFKLSSIPLGSLERLESKHPGSFYFQQASSLLPVLALDPKPGEKILDIASAPGSKTTQIAQLMCDKGYILACDNSEERMQVLRSAVDRLGITNIDCWLGNGQTLGDRFKEEFDKVLVDVPCSCEGIIRYKAHKFFEWSLLGIHRLVPIQFQLLESGFKSLKKGGTLVYSTCTYGSEENEAVVSRLLEAYPSADLVPIRFSGIQPFQGFTCHDGYTFDKRVIDTVRIFPQTLDSIGFFIAKIIKLKCAR